MNERELHVLFLCTHNSARSQMAEAILNNRRSTALRASSAGSAPATAVHPAALAELRRLGIDWSHARPKSLADLPRREWDLVITVCDRARETCPTFPGRPIVMHWSLPDPSEVNGTEEQVARTFQDVGMVLSRRIDLMLSLPVEKLGELAAEQLAGSA